jgi:hypothetical protein
MVFLGLLKNAKLIGFYSGAGYKASDENQGLLF